MKEKSVVLTTFYNLSKLLTVIHIVCINGKKIIDDL